MLQADEPGDYVLATGRTETVRTFVSMAFKALDIDLAWSGQGEAECGRDAATGKVLVKINPRFYRQAEVEVLIGNAGKARTRLEWEPQTTLEQLCQMMTEVDLRRNVQGLSF